MDNVTMTEYRGIDTEVIILFEIQGKPVTGIELGAALNDCTSLIILNNIEDV